MNVGSPMIVEARFTSPHVLDRARLERSVLEVIQAWASAHPQELYLIEKKCRQIKDGLIHRKGFSRDQNFLHVAEIPVNLNHYMTLVFGRFWSRDRRLLHMFLELFQVGRINGTTLPNTRFDV